MIGKSGLLLLVIALFAVCDAHAYFFSATDGQNLYLFKAEVGSNGNLATTSEFKYPAPGSMGSTALLPTSGTNETKKVFDLFGVFSKDGKPVVFSDRVEFDETTNTWKAGTRRIFTKHKVDSFNNISAAVVTGDLANFPNAPLAKGKYLLTENGSNTNSRKISSSGKLTGPNKATFKNPASFDPLSGALSPEGDFAIQSSFVSSGAAPSQSSTQASQRVLSIKNLADNKRADYAVSGDIFSLALAINTLSLCSVWKELQRSFPTTQPGIAAAAADKTGVFLLNINRQNLTPEKIVTISKKKSTSLGNFEIFNTAFLLPDGKGIVFSKQKSGKLEYKFQRLDGACGPKAGKATSFLARTNPTIANNNPIYGWAAAACAAGLYPGIC